MADIREWGKGITFFLFVTLMFYFLWTNIFSNIIEFVGSDVFQIGTEAGTSMAIMKAMAWVSFVLLYLSIGGIYLIYSIIIGARGGKTYPLEFLKAIGLWAILMPFLTFIYGLTFYMVDTLNASNVIDTGMETTATMFSWILGLIVMTALVIFPFIFIIKGYGINIMGERKDE